jgi:dTDP-4-dehydrorhamnose 3,5-epimerase
MGDLSIDDISVTKLNVFPAEGGLVKRVIRHNDHGFKCFKEAYFSSISPGIIRGWKLHTKMTLNLVVPIGKVKFVFTSNLSLGRFRAEIIGENNYCRITVPPNIWFAFQGLENKESIILNIADFIHDPSESQRLNILEIKYDW